MMIANPAISQWVHRLLVKGVEMNRRCTATQVRCTLLRVLLFSSAALIALAGCACGGSRSSFSDMGAGPLQNSGGGVLPSGSDSGLSGLFVEDGGFSGVLGVDGSLSAGLDDDAGGFSGVLAGPFHDLPPAPILDAPDAGGLAIPDTVGALFGGPSQGAPSGGPCLIEPEVDSVYPNNWLRPRFTWVPVAGQNVFELRLSAANQAETLVMYTTQTSWTMPQPMWDALRAHSQAVAMTVSIRGAELAGAALQNEAIGSSGPLEIAPAPAPGVIVYWAIVDSSAQFGTLKGFAVGDETVVSVLAPSQAQERAPATPPCIGCHTSTPDGLNVVFSIGPNPDWPYTNSIGTIGSTGTPGLMPSFLTPDAKVALDSLKGIAVFSLAHWAAGDRVVLLSDTGQDLNWVNLEGTASQATGIVPRTGTDNGAVTNPAWSHDGSTIVYTSLPLDGITDGRPNTGPMDLYSMPYGGGAGGAQIPLAGASDPSVEEYYPAFSPDDQYVIFNRVPQGQSSYNNPSDELYLVPAAGGTPLRLAANDPPACTGAQSPGVTNSWGKWAPIAQPVPALGRTYYWVVFSSTRYPGNVPQLFLTAVVADSSNHLTTYGSLYLWNQPAAEHNHTPAWDVFRIPPRPPPPVVR